MASYKLIGTIVKVNGDCHAGHYVGEEFDLTLFSEEMKRARKAHRTPNLCAFFYDVLFPYVVMLQFGGSFPWEQDKNLFEAQVAQTATRSSCRYEESKHSSRSVKQSQLFY